MRSKEVEEAIKRTGQLYNGISVGLIINVKSDGTTCKSLETVLSYIETLEQLPNKIDNKIKELEEELKSIQDKLSKNMLFSESEFYSFSEYTKWRVEINQKIKDINAKIQVLKEL